MKKEYDFSQSKRNPYAKKFKQQVSIRLEKTSIDYFKKLAVETGISYQNLINLFLRECVEKEKKPTIRWAVR